MQYKMPSQGWPEGCLLLLLEEAEFRVCFRGGNEFLESRFYFSVLKLSNEFRFELVTLVLAIPIRLTMSDLRSWYS